MLFLNVFANSGSSSAKRNRADSATRKRTGQSGQFQGPMRPSASRVGSELTGPRNSQVRRATEGTRTNVSAASNTAGVSGSFRRNSRTRATQGTRNSAR